ncbi:MAG TPA: hypothetical protein VHF89_16005 [Solirubrobacteraceae bacterium]|nr:hypothetical protein [Solirubrobacteraceae bacterium]
MRYERLLLGDWHPVVRDPIDVLRLTFLIGAAGFLLSGDVKGTANLLLGATVVLVARAIDLPRPYDLGLVLAMTLTGWGEALGLFERIVFYDNVVHFLVPGLVAPVLYMLCVRLHVLPDLDDPAARRGELGLFLTTFALGMAVGGVYEVVEWAADGTVGSNLSTGNGDTNSDLLSDMLGSIGGAYLLVVWSRAGWTTVRRAPREAVVRWLEQRRAEA